MLEGRHPMSISQINVKSTAFETCLKKNKQSVQLIKRREISIQDGTRIWLVRSWAGVEGGAGLKIQRRLSQAWLRSLLPCDEPSLSSFASSLPLSLSKYVHRK